ncbi:hypothetical protein [Streptomyces sp. NPDC017940]|uniref:hypothetical protein n=1 Tax=Streptomyces sp. NPDC017940 TaxID=3365017 RepID=UPI0037938F51
MELSVRSPPGELIVDALMDDLDEELPPLAKAGPGPGSYRLRVREWDILRRSLKSDT